MKGINQIYLRMNSRIILSLACIDMYLYKKNRILIFTEFCFGVFERIVLIFLPVNGLQEPADIIFV